MMPNMAAFAPMAMPNVAMTIVLKPGEYRIARRTYRMSWPSVSSDGTPIAVPAVFLERRAIPEPPSRGINGVLLTHASVSVPPPEARDGIASRLPSRGRTGPEEVVPRTQPESAKP
jgi:hypothetical protein